MTLIAMPTSVNLVNFQIFLDQRQQVNRSEWTNTRKVSAAPGAQKWSARFSPHEIIEDAHKKEWRAFLFALEGQANTFNLTVATGQHSGSRPAVGSGANAGATLPIAGMPANTVLLEAGDYMTVPLPSGHQRLVILTADLISDGSGLGTAQFKPFLNEVPAFGATIETVDPFALMALSGGEQGYSEEFGKMTVEFTAEEAL